MLKFSEYKESRDIVDFDAKFEKLCEELAIYQVPFNEFWEACVLPVLAESKSPDTILEGIGSMLKKWFSGKDAPVDPREEQRQKHLQSMQGKVTQYVNTIKQAFANGMKTFVDKFQDDAKDKYEYYIAQAFYNKMMKLAGNWTINTSFGPGSEQQQTSYGMYGQKQAEKERRAAAARQAELERLYGPGTSRHIINSDPGSSQHVTSYTT